MLKSGKHVAMVFRKTLQPLHFNGMKDKLTMQTMKNRKEKNFIVIKISITFHVICL